jgi:hypothetical protein
MRAVAPKSERQCEPRLEMIIFRTPCRQHTSNVDLYILLNVVVGMHGYKVGRLGESIDNQPNQIKFAGSQR